ncbi:MAG: sialate O-acetylesterase [Planctomycetota bacterium]
MNQPKTLRAFVALLAALACAQASADDFYVYFLAGQSNMVGFGTSTDLPGELAEPMPGVYIFAPAQADDGAAPPSATWQPLQPGFGDGYTTDPAGQPMLGTRFGPAITFAARLRDLRPGENIAIIKYAKNGSGLDVRSNQFGTWDPNDTRANVGGINQYDHALAAIASAFADGDINDDGTPDRLIPAGIVWMQGESDATLSVAAEDYAENLAEILGLFRGVFGVEDLPAVIGRISDSGVRNGTDPVWPHGDTVRAAQHAVAKADPRTAIVTSTDSYDYSDRFHYDSAGYIDLGQRFAEAINTLAGRPRALVRSPAGGTERARTR